MAKDPAFLFYPGDWHLGTMHLNMLEKGCYLELLMLQFSKGKFTIANAKHMLRDSFNVAWPNIKDKFQTDGTFFWNQRLAEEKVKRAKFTESRRLNGSGQKKTNSLTKNNKKHMQKHMENEDENKNLLFADFLFDSINKLQLTSTKYNLFNTYCYHNYSSYQQWSNC